MRFSTFWSAWQELKRDPASPTLMHMKLLIAHLVSISERRNLLPPDLFTGVPHSKIKQFAAQMMEVAEQDVVLENGYAKVAGSDVRRSFREVAAVAVGMPGFSMAGGPTPVCFYAASSGQTARSASGATPRSCARCGSARWPSCAERSSPSTPRRWPASCPPGTG